MVILVPDHDCRLTHHQFAGVIEHLRPTVVAGCLLKRFLPAVAAEPKEKDQQQRGKPPELFWK